MKQMEKANLLVDLNLIRAFIYVSSWVDAAVKYNVLEKPHFPIKKRKFNFQRKKKEKKEICWASDPGPKDWGPMQPRLWLKQDVQTHTFLSKLTHA